MTKENKEKEINSILHGSVETAECSIEDLQSKRTEMTTTYSIFIIVLKEYLVKSAIQFIESIRSEKNTKWIEEEFHKKADNILHASATIREVADWMQLEEIAIWFNAMTSIYNAINKMSLIAES